MWVGHLCSLSLSLNLVNECISQQHCGILLREVSNVELLWGKGLFIYLLFIYLLDYVI